METLKKLDIAELVMQAIDDSIIALYAVGVIVTGLGALSQVF